jgi:transcriptional regulator with XRE-family HTH domain
MVALKSFEKIHIIGGLMDIEREKQIIEELKRVIGERVLAQREEIEKRGGKSFSQEELAAKITESGIPVTQGQIGHLESARRLPSVQLLVALADYFDTSVDYLTGRAQNSSSIAAIDEDLQTGGISGRLGDIYKTLPPDKKEEVFRFAAALATISRSDQKALPTDRQLREDEAFGILDSIEGLHGETVRNDVERLWRNKGMIIGSNA